ncbi:MAG: TfoX/Sxy family protein [Fimbriimonadaceae bacterium]|nr:TfoX/Sxy family protein [Fimbriimonadaceae bacterium]QYK56983.1 MAG: TfoX/Sxy family protein [Fimbriimonadaceae bacterium]
MAVTEKEVRRLLEPLEAIREITSRKMFGGVGVYCQGTFFAVVDDDHLYFKSNDDTAPLYDAYDSPQWVIVGEKPAPMPYREVPAEVLADPEKLGQYIDAAVALAKSKKKPKKKA